MVSSLSGALDVSAGRVRTNTIAAAICLMAMLDVLLTSNLQLQFAGAAVVTAGVCMAAWPSAAGSSLLAQACLAVFLPCSHTH